MSSGAPSQKGADDASGAPALTRHNLKRFNIHKRKETARRRGRSTPSASPDFHSYCETVSSADLPSPSQRPTRRIKKQTASELAAEEAMLNALYDAHPRERPVDPLHALIAQGASGNNGQPDSPRQAASVSAGVRASVSEGAQGSIPEGGPDNGAPRQSMADDAASKVTSHSGPARPVTDDGPVPAEYDNGHPEGQYDNGHPARYYNGYPSHHGYPSGQLWSYAPPQPGLPTDRPTIPRQQPSDGSPGNPESRFPANFPAYHCTQNMNEIAAYLANASYVAALGGPPLADLKYGIIIVPAGEERLLFGPPSQSLLNQDFIDAIDDANRDYDRALRMHDPDKDSEEFVRSRFDDDFASVSAAAQQNVDTTLADERGGEDRRGAKDDDSTTADAEEPQPKRPRRGPQRKSARVNAHENASARNNVASSGRASISPKRVAPATDTVEPQGKPRARRTPRATGRRADSPSKPAAKRTLRGKK
ncbi:predicted protein [Chaetomium globosum CBS 148.51]|uniref:Uncharacterized protein n=1 Tax=Chaetomium globosum (strain ATCC 6205 / CBS 148.51 / DSM 1962 / NBRC 6347 / NRRL 1970) TaxID=306901 RepID=Q2GT89_CHAGB|nr:uncharacterized protein CHGG_08815 [Chaetomium globosum CBS 148.51]EAQ84801.1 predicted protein [Chaetomium globosum CBS 148.51]